MSSWISHLDPLQWGSFLQTIGESVETPQQGKLQTSESEAKITFIPPGSTTEVVLSLDDIIEVSKQKLQSLAESTGNDTKLEEKKIVEGLSGLKDKLKQVVDDKNFYGKPISNSIIFFQDDLEEVFRTVATEKTEEEQLTALAKERRLDVKDFEKVQSIIKGDRNLLFDITEYHESFFDLTRHVSTEPLLDKEAIDTIDNLKSLTPENREFFKKYLFDKSTGESLFETLMKRSDANELFDKLLKYTDDDELNDPSNKDRKVQIFDFAYSTERYSHIFMKEEDLSSSIIQEAETLAVELRISSEGTIEEKYISINSETYLKWREMVMSSSSTIAAKSEEGTQSRQRWVRAQRILSRRAVSDKGTKEKVLFDVISEAHEILAEGEKGVQHPGKLRTGIVRTSGGWGALYPPGFYLNKNVNAFMVWLNEGLVECDSGKKNPIILAAEAYQRLVSLHPFENGNGRISRMLMGYVLERFNFPQPVLGSDIEVAVFPLKTVHVKPEEVLRKILNGLVKSSTMLNQ